MAARKIQLTGSVWIIADGRSVNLSYTEDQIGIAHSDTDFTNPVPNQQRPMTIRWRPEPKPKEVRITSWPLEDDEFRSDEPDAANWFEQTISDSTCRIAPAPMTMQWTRA